MSKKGRKPKPTALKKAQGNPGRRPLPENEPQPNELDSMPRAPSFLNVEGRKFWKKVGSELIDCGLLTKIDLPAFGMLCHAYQNCLEIHGKLEESGLIYSTPSGIERPHPLWKIAKDEGRNLLNLAKEFGLTPSSRTGLKIEPKIAEVDELDNLIRLSQE